MDIPVIVVVVVLLVWAGWLNSSIGTLRTRIATLEGVVMRMQGGPGDPTRKSAAGAPAVPSEPIDIEPFVD